MDNEKLDSVMDINTMLDYQADAIVSRVILKEDKGNITMFAFDKGQELSEHTAPFDAIVQVTEGQAQISIGGKPHKLNAGKLILMPANISHAVLAEEKFKMILTMIKK